MANTNCSPAYVPVLTSPCLLPRLRGRRFPPCHTWTWRWSPRSAPRRTSTTSTWRCRSTRWAQGGYRSSCFHGPGLVPGLLPSKPSPPLVLEPAYRASLCLAIPVTSSCRRTSSSRSSRTARHPCQHRPCPRLSRSLVPPPVPPCPGPTQVRACLPLGPTPPQPLAPSRPAPLLAPPAR